MTLTKNTVVFMDIHISIDKDVDVEYCCMGICKTIKEPLIQKEA